MGWGDELIVTGIARKMQEQDRRKLRIVYEGRVSEWCELWHGNPRIARRNERGNFRMLQARSNGLRPYMAARSPRQWTWKQYAPPVGEIYFTDAERQFGARHGGRLIVEPNLKQTASPNKDWGWARWVALADLLLVRYGIRVTQLGPAGTRLLPGAEHVLTPSIRAAAAVMAAARAAVLTEGGLHHVAAAVGTRAIVIYGGYISPAVTGYEQQMGFFTGEGLGCGMRVPCAHCRDAMARIEPTPVAESLAGLLEQRTAA
jgi:ADP-heptose:LPS heptosyltransferase